MNIKKLMLISLTSFIACIATAHSADEDISYDKWFTGEAQDRKLHMLAYAAYSQSMQYPELTIQQFAEAVPEKASPEIRHALLILIKSRKWEVGARSNAMAAKLIEAYLRADENASLEVLLDPSCGDVMANAVLKKMGNQNKIYENKIGAVILNSEGDLNDKEVLLWAHTVAHSIVFGGIKELSPDSVKKLEMSANDLPKYIAFIYNGLKENNNTIERAKYFTDKYGENINFIRFFLSREFTENSNYIKIVNELVSKILKGNPSTASESIILLILSRINPVNINESSLPWIQAIANREIELPESIKLTDPSEGFRVTYHLLLNKTTAKGLLMADSK